MRRARFIAAGRLHEGRLEDGVLTDAAGRPHREDGVTWLPPVAPGKVIGLALNFADHAGELGLARPENPVLFIKPPNTFVGHRAPVVYPAGVDYLHYECELGVVIGRRCRRVPAERAMDMVRGYTIGNDVTVRDFVANLYRPPIKAKGWDTFGPLGPWLVEDEIADPGALGLRTYVNGELRQEGHTSQFVHSVPELIAYISFFMTLERDDIILTGTPKGISHVYPGDVMRLEIDGIGALENPVIADESTRDTTKDRYR